MTIAPPFPLSMPDPGLSVATRESGPRPYYEDRHFLAAVFAHSGHVDGAPSDAHDHPANHHEGRSRKTESHGSDYSFFGGGNQRSFLLVRSSSSSLTSTPSDEMAEFLTAADGLSSNIGGLDDCANSVSDTTGCSSPSGTLPLTALSAVIDGSKAQAEEANFAGNHHQVDPHLLCHKLHAITRNVAPVSPDPESEIVSVSGELRKSSFCL